MRIMRSRDQWLKLVNEQQASGLTIVDFCQEKKLSTTTFYSAKKKLTEQTSGFVKAKVTQEIEVTKPIESISIAYGKARIELPDTTSVSYLAQLLKGIA